MPVRLRSARLSERDEVPLHWEACRLGRLWRLAGWLGGASVAAGGVAAMVLGQGSFLEALGAVAAAAGSVILALTIRCHTWSTSVGRHWLRTGVGPFVKMVPVGVVGSCSIVPASGLRRLFARREVVLALTMGHPSVRIPSCEPETLQRVLTSGGLASEGDGADLGS